MTPNLICCHMNRFRFFHLLVCKLPFQQWKFVYYCQPHIQLSVQCCYTSMVISQLLSYATFTTVILCTLVGGRGGVNHYPLECSVYVQLLLPSLPLISKVAWVTTLFHHHLQLDCFIYLQYISILLPHLTFHPGIL